MRMSRADQAIDLVLIQDALQIGAVPVRHPLLAVDRAALPDVHPNSPVARRMLKPFQITSSLSLTSGD